MKSFPHVLSKILVLMGTAAMLASLGACGGGGGSNSPSSSSGGTLTSSSITLPSNVQVVTAH